MTATEEGQVVGSEPLAAAPPPSPAAAATPPAEARRGFVATLVGLYV
jgi:hypothetical protein